MARTSLPPGFRFHPTDVELVKYYLKKKVMGKKLKFEAISELNIYKYSPWDLPDKSCLRSKDLEWYFFCPTERKYASGARSNRATESGYWKSTGKDRPVLYNEQSVGMIKTLVFHIGHAPKGERTNWVMYEYRSKDQELENAGVVQDAYVICKVFQKSGPGPKNGAQYGAPFNEEDWDDDDDDDETCTKSLTSVRLPPPALPGNSSVFVPGSRCSGHLSGPGPSNAMSSGHEVSPPVPDICEDITSMLDMFTEDSSLLLDHNGNNKVENFNHVENNRGLPCLDGNEICNGLGDLANMAELNGGGFNSRSHQMIGNGLNTIFACNDLGFLELSDLNNPLYFPTDSTGYGHLLTNTLCEPSNNNDCLEQNYCPLYSFGSIQHDSTMNQSLLMPEESNGHGSHFHPFQKENGIGGTVNLGFTSTSWNANVTLCEQPEERSRHAAQAEQDPNRDRFCYIWG